MSKIIEKYRELVIGVGDNNEDFMNRYTYLIKCNLHKPNIYPMLQKEFKINSIFEVEVISKLLQYFNRKVQFIENLNGNMTECIIEVVIQKDIEELNNISKYINFLRDGNNFESLLIEIVKDNGYDIDGDIIDFIGDRYYVNVFKNIIEKL